VSRSPVTAAVAGFAAGLAAAVLIVGISGATGTFDSTSTTTVVRERPAPESTTPLPAVERRPGSFDPERIYRSRIGGVVTIASTVAGEEIAGTGFVADDRGSILTNAHVVTNSGDSGVAADAVEEATSVFVTFAAGDQVNGEVVGYDLFDDIAVVRVSDPGLSLQPLPLGDSDRVRVVEPVAAIGSPFSQAGSLSTGVVSAVNRSIPTFVTRYSIPGAIQTDAAINHGNSGGPLFNARGEVIGINAQINTTGGGGEGVGFAVPIDAARRSLRELLAEGHVSYGWLGVQAGTVTRDLAETFHLPVEEGALLESVTPGGPAEDAGLRGGSQSRPYHGTTVSPDGDVVVSVDRHHIASADDLVKVMATYGAGDRVRIAYWRDGRRADVEVTPAERPLGPTP
jgi:2-alkenal reductase